MRACQFRPSRKIAGRIDGRPGDLRRKHSGGSAFSIISSMWSQGVPTSSPFLNVDRGWRDRLNGLGMRRCGYSHAEYETRDEPRCYSARRYSRSARYKSIVFQPRATLCSRLRPQRSCRIDANRRKLLNSLLPTAVSEVIFQGGAIRTPPRPFVGTCANTAYIKHFSQALVAVVKQVPWICQREVRDF